MAVGLVLASESPQRRSLLASLGLRFEVIAPAVSELEAGLPPIELALANARTKAEAVAAGSVPKTNVVIAADTVVDFGGLPFGKPADEADATRMIGALSCARHFVHTAVAVSGAAGCVCAAETTTVHFRRLDADAVEAYVSLGEWRGRAGGYAIQSAGGTLIRSIEGDVSNVIGLPLGLTASLLHDAGVTTAAAALLEPGRGHAR